MTASAAQLQAQLDDALRTGQREYELAVSDLDLRRRTLESQHKAAAKALRDAHQAALDRRACDIQRRHHAKLVGLVKAFRKAPDRATAMAIATACQEAEAALARDAAAELTDWQCGALAFFEVLAEESPGAADMYLSGAWRHTDYRTVGRYAAEARAAFLSPHCEPASAFKAVSELEQSAAQVPARFCYEMDPDPKVRAQLHSVFVAGGTSTTRTRELERIRREAEEARARARAARSTPNAVLISGAY